MLRLEPAGGIACVYLLVVHQKQMSTRVNILVWMLRLLERKRRRLDVATDCPAARDLFVTVACCWYLASAAIRFDDVSGATSFELVATLRFEVATGTSREKRCIVLFLRLDTQPLYTCWFGKLLASTVVPADYVGGNALLLVAAVETLDSSREALSLFTSFKSCNWLVEEREVAAVRVLRRPGRTTFWLLPESSGFLAVLIIAQKYKQQQQVAQQSGRQRFRPRGQQFKKKSGSGSSGSGISSSSGSRTEFCGFCGGKHPSTQCIGVQGSCNLCGQYGYFARVCPSAGSQQTAAQPQGRGGNPGSTAGRGVNPAGGAPGGG
ncbi:hypothetical protein F511_24158 [Dorcoceras hygrometricum]|uniref:CCHC-type domain-containing protein n=1 Tax=Dorcoceras hygrometricum TaxID=472368 RepID=A0A2Z7CK04_9LAMI|nr:hypothetical protein F511_24158 [Dorcoceras hygrometricum]